MQTDEINYAQSAVARYSRNSLAPSRYDYIISLRAAESRRSKPARPWAFHSSEGASRSGIYNRRPAGQRITGHHARTTHASSIQSSVITTRLATRLAS